MTGARVVIDLNDRTPEGLSMVFLTEVQGLLNIGDTVLAVEPEDGVCAPAHVVSINEDRGYAMVRVAWDELRQVAPESELTTVSPTLGDLLSELTNLNEVAIRGLHWHLKPSDRPFAVIVDVGTSGATSLRTRYSRRLPWPQPLLVKQQGEFV